MGRQVGNCDELQKALAPVAWRTRRGQKGGKAETKDSGGSVRAKLVTERVIQSARNTAFCVRKYSNRAVVPHGGREPRGTQSDQQSFLL